MSKKIQRVTGMLDLLPDQTGLWQKLEQTCQNILSRYGYHEVRMPLLEKTALFSRSIGEVTDIVEKEMYTFVDLDGQSLSLRPEGTASCARSYIENNMQRQGCQRLWYQGPMFRHEKPQLGRYRQFYQLGVEVFGVPGPDIDAELILMNARLWRELGLKNIVLEINSLGTLACRQSYQERLVGYFTQHFTELDEDSQRRLQRNPMRILDSKNPAMAALLAAAPQLVEYLDAESAGHFHALRVFLDDAEIEYRVNPRIVRGLDYYNRTVFEWSCDQLGAQSAVCAGGRYDTLVEQLGGAAIPAIGFALGLDRTILLMKKQAIESQSIPDCYLVMLGAKAESAGMQLAERLRSGLPKLKLVRHIGGGSLKSQMKRADRSQAAMALILGEDEMLAQRVAIKHLRKAQDQEDVALCDLIPYIGRHVLDKS